MTHLIKSFLDSKNFDMVKELINRNDTDLSFENNFLIKRVMKLGNVDIFKMLLNDVRVTRNLSLEDCEELIISSSGSGDYRMVELLLKSGKVDPSCKGNRCIKWACNKGYYEVARLLLSDTRVDPTVDDNYCIIISCEYGRHEMVELLMTPRWVGGENGSESSDENSGRVLLPIPDLKAQNNRSFKLASKYGHDETMKMLLKYGGVTNEK
jgi:ankyrin repeat protein